MVDMFGALDTAAHGLDLSRLQTGTGTITGSGIYSDQSGVDRTVDNLLEGSLASLVKGGSGALTLSRANTFGGGVTLSGGTVVLGNAGALGSSGTIRFEGGTLALAGAGRLGSGGITANGGLLDLGGTSQEGPVVVASGTIRNGTLIAENLDGRSGRIEATLAGAGQRTKSSAGTLWVGGVNT